MQKSPQNSKESLVYFEPDQSKLFVVMPKREKGIIWLGQNSDQLRWIHFSYLNIKTLFEKNDTYVAQNSLGQKIKIDRLKKKGIGIAILNPVGGYTAKPQSFMLTMERQLVSDILKKGRLEMSVFVDAQYANFHGKTMLIDSGQNFNPDMKYPIDIEEVLHGLPVRLAFLKLYDGNGQKIGEWQPEQIFSSSISK